jgi:hypothetical protein
MTWLMSWSGDGGRLRTSDFNRLLLVISMISRDIHDNFPESVPGRLSASRPHGCSRSPSQCGVRLPESWGQRSELNQLHYGRLVLLQHDVDEHDALAPRRYSPRFQKNGNSECIQHESRRPCSSADRFPVTGQPGQPGHLTPRQGGGLHSTRITTTCHTTRETQRQD